MLPFEFSYRQLPERFYAVVNPTPVAAPRLIALNTPLAMELGLDPDWLSSPQGIELLSGNYSPGETGPIALAYAGHQFGHFVSQLGDGRAVLLGEVIDRHGGRRDIQLKGSGRTPFSRRGDGRAALGPVLREYILSEAMAALGVPTTRALAAVATGETVAREDILPGAILTRVASSHIRIGTFEFFATRRDVEGVRALADYVIARHYPKAAENGAPYLDLLNAVVAAQAHLVAHWMLLGFIHGVMNTDNVAVSGETIDYGPCAFMDSYDPGAVFSSIDEGGRYAYGNQPPIARWNLARLAEALLPLLAEDQKNAISLAKNALGAFDSQFEAAYLAGMRAKLGLVDQHQGDLLLIKGLLDAMHRENADFTLTFRYLSDLSGHLDHEEATAYFADMPSLRNWVRQWQQRLADDPQTGTERCAAMRRINPLFIPRNHLVERMIEAAVARSDFAPFNELLNVLRNPYEKQSSRMHYAAAPKVHERVFQTFCGT
ncbi:protein adenylyltransferase SelO (plasmid) [Nitrobacteraceae bacterium UC4446_H13]